METIRILNKLKAAENRHDIIFWQYCDRPKATIEKVCKSINRKNPISGHSWTEYIWTGVYLVAGYGDIFRTKDLAIAETKQQQFQLNIDNMPRRRFAMPRTLSDLIKGHIYAGSQIKPEQTTLFA